MGGAHLHIDIPMKIGVEKSFSWTLVRASAWITVGEFKKWGKTLLKQGIFSVGNVDHLLCLGKLEHPYESRIRHQYHIKYACLPLSKKIPGANILSCTGYRCMTLEQIAKERCCTSNLYERA
jgi:hypothetical protein